jgi:predicted enzyme related to lactoylglutathione lyase
MPPRFALALFLCVVGCRMIDVEQPIALVPEPTWGEDLVTSLSNAAECWNRQFGTQLEVTREPSHDQQVSVELSDGTCAFSGGGYTQLAPPPRVTLCTTCYRTEGISTFDATVLHELGHVLNIINHVDYGVMSTSGFPPPAQFTLADRRAFAEANPDARLDPWCNVDIEVRLGPTPNLRCRCP